MSLEALSSNGRRYAVVGGSSSVQQAMREAEAAGTWGWWYVEWLLDARQEREAVRAAKRGQREARWREVAAGEREPLSPDAVDALWSDLPEGEGKAGTARSIRRRNVEAALA